jgi:predicted  nucleic acid-binding Zn-ribbon protein
LKRRYRGELDAIRSRIEHVPRKQESAFDHQLRGALALVYDAARALAHLEKEQANADSKIKQARQNIERASDQLLSIKGELASSLLEPASKLRLLGRMLEAFESNEEQKSFALIVQVASDMSALLGRGERMGVALSANNLSPVARAKAAAYFKLLANP